MQFYEQALEEKQKQIEAICISSFNKDNNEVDSRFVNLKFVLNKKFIFFTNYHSKKAIQFKKHNQVSVVILWKKINVQIRMKANIEKTEQEFNQQYFSERSFEKNALAISSHQSQTVKSFDVVKSNYENTLSSDDLLKCPEYWGGFSFIPYEFEFWEGDKNRLNKRNLYISDGNAWSHYVLQP